MDRVGRYVDIAVPEPNIDHDEVVDMIQMISNAVCRDPAGDTSNNKIASGTTTDLVRHMWRNMELPIAPTELKL